MLFYAAALQTLNYDWDTLQPCSLGSGAQIRTEAAKKMS